MGKLFVPYELAVKLKEKGFDEYCFAYYDKNKTLLSGGSVAHSQRLTSLKNSNIQYGGKEFVDCPTAPTHDQVIDWFIEKHKIQLKVTALELENNTVKLETTNNVSDYLKPKITTNGYITITKIK